ncbi:MAG: ABC transporter ATP-binding protein [Kiritimatiellae bacterium]|jgi:putative ABC transport system ATP-binding protein|nr:ABC transporter ATP-binding protein [Kiritimatiellia bacterium]
MSNNVIEFKDIKKIYNPDTIPVKALDGVTHKFKCGSFWAIMGTSGSGKSTMLNILGCLDRPTSGDYMINDEDPMFMTDSQLSELRLRSLGFIFQSFNLLPQLTVCENIELPLFYLGIHPDASRERAEKLADMVGLKDRLEHKPFELSGGQQQRVAVARALTNDPEIILADEPTGNLDSETSVQIMDMLTNLNKQGKTIIMVTHEHDIAAHAKSCLHMRDGKIEKVE